MRMTAASWIHRRLGRHAIHEPPRRLPALRRCRSWRRRWRAASADATSRLKDIASLQGAQTVPLIGYGLVVGLNKTGDKQQTIFPAQTLANMLERFGVAVPGGLIKIENIAAVIVTAELPPYARIGARARRHRLVDRRRAKPPGRRAAADAAARAGRQDRARAQGAALDRRLWRRQRREQRAGQSPHGRPRAGGRPRSGRVST